MIPARSRGNAVRTSGRATEGLTLVEVLVALAVTGLLVGSAAMLYTAMIDALRTSDAGFRMLENLSLAGERIAGDLRRAARRNPTAPGGTFHFVGIDEDGTFENSLGDPHRDVVRSRANWDRLHFHTLDPDVRLTGSCGSGGVCSERAYHAYWINGPRSTRTVFGLTEHTGLARRRIRHRTPGETLPRLDGSRSPVFSLDNTANPDRTGAGPVSFRIDYFSLRFFDPASSRWVNCWDTTGSAPRPSGCVPPSTDRLPAAVGFALRGYDPAGNTAGDEHDPKPTWYERTVDLR